MARKPSGKTAPASTAGQDPFELNPRKRGPAPEWLPDWRARSRYSFGSPRGLAWEFLRRNPEYLGYWHSMLWNLKTGTIEEEEKDEEIARGNQAEYAFCELFGVSELHHPEQDGWQLDHFHSHRLGPWFGEDALERPSSGSNFLVSFDLRSSIEKQLEVVTRRLIWERQQLTVKPRRNPIRMRIPELCRYLRAYDAAWSGAKDAEIAEALNTDTVRAVQRYIRNAQNYIGQRYRTLLL